MEAGQGGVAGSVGTHPRSLTIATDVGQRYLDLLKGTLTRDLFPASNLQDVIAWDPNEVMAHPDDVWAFLQRRGWRLVKLAKGDTDGQSKFPADAETMVSLARLNNVEALVRSVLEDEVRGDLVETGVWRGGTVIFMRALLATYGVTDRRVWVCDSFQGLPEVDVDRYPADEMMRVSDARIKAMLDLGLAVSVEQVKANFARYGLLDEQVCFLEGWFEDTLPTAPIDEISVLRLDGDMYSSTMEALVNLESKVSPGGYVIVDDYKSIDACERAVTDYRQARGITSQIEEIDWTGVYWRKT